MHLVFSSHTTCFSALFYVLRATANVLRNKIINTLMCCKSTLPFRSATSISTRSQGDGASRNTATLLSLKVYKCTYIRIYTHAYRASIGTGSELLRPRGLVSA